MHYVIGLRHQPKSLLALSGLIFGIVWGVGSGHLPLAPTTQAGTRVISLYADGQKRIISTTAPTVGDVLSRAGVTLGRNDLVEPSAATPIPEGFFNINVYRAKPVTVVDRGHAYRLRSAYSSPRLLAEAAGLRVYPQDQYVSRVMTNFVDQQNVGIKLTIERSLPFTVEADGVVKQYRAQPGTVDAALTAAGVPRGLQDIVSAPLSAPLTANMHLSIIRVSQAVTTVDQPIAAPVQTVDDPSKPVGYRQIQSPGSVGHRQVTYRIHYRDGVETSRDVLRVTGYVAPQPQIVTVGTKVVFAGSVEYWRPLVMTAAAEYGLDPATMMRIMNCESTGNALASNGSHFGLYQYLPSTWRSAGGSDSNIFDGATQIQLTARYMSVHGTGAWQCR